MSKKLTTEDFIRKAKLVHGDKYDYSKVDYKGNKEKVCIICPEHGEFWQSPVNHCSKHNKNYTQEQYYNILDLIDFCSIDLKI